MAHGHGIPRTMCKLSLARVLRDDPVASRSLGRAFRGRHGGVEKRRGVENLTNDTPPKKGFWTPPRTVRFPPPSGVSTLFFLYKNPRQSRPEALLEGSKNFRESAFSGTFSSPHTFCTPPYHGPKLELHKLCMECGHEVHSPGLGLSPRPPCLGWPS